MSHLARLLRCLRVQFSGEPMFFLKAKRLLGIITPAAMGLTIGAYLGIHIAQGIRNHDIERSTRSLHQLEVITAALDAYKVDHNCYPAVRSIEVLIDILDPYCVSPPQSRDGFGHPLRYESWREESESPGPDNYGLASPGKEGVLNGTLQYSICEHPVPRFETAIIVRNGFFIAWPALGCPKPQ